MNLKYIRDFPDSCDAEVTRKGEAVPCDKPAVAARFDPAYPLRPYPVCVHHARVGQMVPLRTLLAQDGQP